MMTTLKPAFDFQQTRRAFLGRASMGLGSVALASLLKPDLLGIEPGLSGFPNAPAKVKRVIFLCMAGGPAHLELHCIVDNLATHGTEAVEEFLDAHHRVFLHRTPTHASWLNQIEMWFSILTRQLLDTAEFAHTSDLATAILDYIDQYNNRAKPFKWTHKPTNNSPKTYARDH